MNRVCATFYLHHTMIIGESIPERQPVNLRLMNPGSRTHCSLHSTRRTAASTPQTLLVASICRVAGNTLPQYMTDCCIHTSDIARRQHLRSAGCRQLFVPRHRRSMFGRRAFSVAGPAAWNSLPDCLRDPLRVPLTVFATT